MARHLIPFVVLHANTLHARSAECSAIGSFDGESDDDAKWMQVATEGLYLGYGGGKKPFAFTRKHFDQAVLNIHTHPSYKAGANGEGEADVIPWDFDHSSEMDPTSGALPASGSPAQGWTRDLKIVEGPLGKSQLWALTRFLEPARSYVKAGKYKWASVAAWFDAVDPVTAKDRGMVVTSIALTNQPFIQGMGQLAANARSGAAPETTPPAKALLDLDRYFDAARTAEEAVCSLKSLLDLPVLATLDDLVAALMQVSAWAKNGDAPAGIPIEKIAGGIRKILGLPVLSTMQDVIDNVATIVQRYAEEQAVAAGKTNSMQPVAASQQRGRQMDLSKILAGKFGVRVNDEDVIAAADEHVTLRAGLAKHFQCRDSNKAILDAAAEQQAEVSKGAAAIAKLGNFLKALGVADVEAGIASVTKLMQDSDTLAKAMPELKSLRDAQAAAEEKAIEADVTAAMASRGLKGEGFKVALTGMRKSDPEKFAKEFPKVDVPAKQPGVIASLTRPVLAGNGGVPVSVLAGGNRPLAIGEGNAPDLSQYPGTTTTQKAMAYLAATQEGFSKLDYDAQFKAGVTLARQCRAA